MACESHGQVGGTARYCFSPRPKTRHARAEASPASTLCVDDTRPQLLIAKCSCGLMDKAPPSYGGDCGFESHLEYRPCPLLCRACLCAEPCFCLVSEQAQLWPVTLMEKWAARPGTAFRRVPKHSTPVLKLARLALFVLMIRGRSC